MHPRARARFGRGLFADPNPFDTYEQWERSEHRDLPLLDREALQRELGLARLRLLMDEDPSDWLTERVARLTARLAADRQTQTVSNGRAR